MFQYAEPSFFHEDNFCFRIFSFFFFTVTFFLFFFLLRVERTGRWRLRLDSQPSTTAAGVLKGVIKFTATFSRCIYISTSRKVWLESHFAERERDLGFRVGFNFRAALLPVTPFFYWWLRRWDLCSLICFSLYFNFSKEIRRTRRLSFFFSFLFVIKLVSRFRLGFLCWEMCWAFRRAVTFWYSLDMCFAGDFGLLRISLFIIFSQRPVTPVSKIWVSDPVDTRRFFLFHIAFRHVIKKWRAF